MLMSSLCKQRDGYLLVSETITVPNEGTPENTNSRKNIIIKNCAVFTDCMSEINNTQIDKAKHIDTVMPMHNLIEYSDNYSKTSESLCQYYRDGPFVDDNCAITDFPYENDNSLNLKQEQQTEQEMVAQKVLK